MERERGMVQQPPAKRMKLAPVVPVAAGGGGGGEVASPRSRMLGQTLFAVLFLVRARTTVTASISQIGRMLQRYVDRTFYKYHEMISSKLECFQERFDEQIKGLSHEVRQLSRLCSSRHADQQTRLEANQECIAASGSNTNIRLCFLNGLKPPVYTDENLTSQNGAAIKLAMYEGDEMVTSGALSGVKIEILVLREDFSNKCRDNWTEEEFDKHIVQGRDGNDLVLGTAWLTNGVVDLSQIRFKEGSCRKKFIMAARVCKSKKTSGRVQEAIMKPVKVLDRRNKSNEKRHPPRLDDDLYRLEEIARDGVYLKRLQDVGIYNVKGFLKALNEDANNLRAILKMENQQNAWSKLTEHARKCVLEDPQELKRYESKEGNVVFFFNCVHELVGATFPHDYVACKRFDAAQKALVNKWRLHAYDKLKEISPDFVMKGNKPEPISSSTDVALAPSILSVDVSQEIFPNNLLPPYQDLQGTGAAEYSVHDKLVTGPISQVSGGVPTVINGPNANYYQDQGTPLPCRQQVTSRWAQNPQGLMDATYQIELEGMDFTYQDLAGASTSGQLEFGLPQHLSQIESAQLEFGLPRHPPQLGSASPAAAPPWAPSIAEQDQSPYCSGFLGSGHPNDFQ